MAKGMSKATGSSISVTKRGARASENTSYEAEGVNAKHAFSSLCVDTVVTYMEI